MKHLAFLLFFAAEASAEPIPLWPGNPPGFRAGAPGEAVKEHGQIQNVSVPAIVPFLPDKATATGMAVIICPGGGYGMLDWKTHVEYAAAWFNPRGIAVIGLKYRTRWDLKMPREELIATALLDAQRAVRLVRHRAVEWGIDPEKVGIAGYSAGANLAMHLAANFDKGDAASSDPVERHSSRPGFAVGLATWHWREKESPFDFPKNAPPVFLVHASNDGLPGKDGRIGGAPIELPRQIEGDLAALGVPVKLVVFDEGGHGVGNLIPQRVASDFPPAKWPELMLAWLDTLPPP